jgi:paraquat-inducible protein B
MVVTLQTLRRILEETHGLLSADSGLGYGMQEALASMRDAADALRALSTSLEQNPDMLIRGKKKPEK